MHAGFLWDAELPKIAPEQWQAMLDVHCTAPLRLIQAASPYMRDAAVEVWQVAYWPKDLRLRRHPLYAELAVAMSTIGQTPCPAQPSVSERTDNPGPPPLSPIHRALTQTAGYAITLRTVEWHYLGWQITRHNRMNQVHTSKALADQIPHRPCPGR